jgi:hypothetical protein
MKLWCSGLRFVGILAVAMVACVKPKSSAKISHLSQEPVAKAPSFLWRASSDEEFFSRVKRIPADNFLPDTHPFALRVNFWVLRIDEMLRKRTPQLLAGVPSPRVKVQRSKEANASASSVEVCISVRVMIEGEEARVGEAPVVFVDRMGSFNSNAPDCVEQNRVSPEKAALDFVTWYNASFSKCRLTATGDTVRVPRKCTNGEFAEMAGAEKLSFLAAVNVITVQSKLPEVFPNEHEFVSVIAHELAHYYRVHGVSSLEKYGYFYRQEKDVSLPLKPSADESFSHLGRRLVKLADFSFAQPLPGLHYRADILPAVRGKLMKELTRVCHAANRCSIPCGSLVSFLKSPETNRALASFPETELTGAGIDAVKQYDQILHACAKDVNYGELGIDGLLWKSLPPGFLSRFEEDVLAARTLDDELRQVSQRVDELEREYSAVIDEANRQRLGYYTTEQEADEFAVDWIAAIGIEPVEAVRQMMTLGEFASTRRATKRDEMPFAECKAQHLRGWKTASGDNSWIPVGRWNDKHHSLCYRAWNMAREIKGHSFGRCVSCGSIDNPPGGDWSALVRELNFIP